jgi:cytochrome c-type biogenesis protein CcmF
MIVELGHFALVLALAAALVQMALPAWGAQRRDWQLMAVAEPAALVQLSLILFAFLALMHAYVTSDFSVETVWANSHAAKTGAGWYRTGASCHASLRVIPDIN